MPYLLPTEAIPDTVEAVRFEFGGTEGLYDHVQVWLGRDEPGFVTVVSNISQIPRTPDELRTPVDTTGWATEWDSAFVARTHPAYVNLHLVDVDNVGFVQVRTRGLDVERTIRIAETLRRRPGGELGWDVPDLPPTFEPFAEGGENPAAFRSITWSDGIERVQAEVRISTDAPEDFELGWSPESDRVSVDINGRAGYMSDFDGTVTIGWAQRPGVLVTTGYRGDARDAATFARSVSEVDGAIWNLQSIEPPSEGYTIRCHSLWC